MINALFISKHLNLFFRALVKVWYVKMELDVLAIRKKELGSVVVLPLIMQGNTAKNTVSKKNWPTSGTATASELLANPNLVRIAMIDLMIIFHTQNKY